ncbi:ATP-binding protein [Candidatus Poriferisodalis sp.]|uniref:hybrid sensor histidine kinase/response regulator n=1 Tax=Candidatus Poriferisodalis sp. TaxID=3101277 RepID=UPI003B026AB0
MADRKSKQSADRATSSRISKLSSAILRINQSLDVATVLEEVLESARELTGAQLGVIITVDERGEIREFVTGGFSPESRRVMVEWPDGPRFFEHLRDLSAPLQIPDLASYLRSIELSVPDWASTTLQGAPMLHQGEHLGMFFLGDKVDDQEDRQEFTGEDEELLVLFASQAATAISNARTHTAVNRARADLEALVETSPIGVVVYDMAAGRVVSSNLEARRIMHKLSNPGQRTKDLLDAVRWRVRDGPDLSLADVPVDQQLEQAAQMRAGEITLSVPDGRRVRTLMNVTPIGSAHGESDSVVITMQDLAGLEELERRRAEFLEMVSHELRAPLTSIKGSAATVLGTTPAPPQAELLQFFRIIDEQADHMRGLISNLLDAGSIEAGTLTVTPQPSSITDLVDRARNNFLSGGGSNPVVIDLSPTLPPAMADPERITQVLNNLLSNAARHAPKTSPIRVEAIHENGFIEISVTDQGSGIPPEQLPHLFKRRSGLADGTGLGLAICKGLVEAHGGRIRAHSAGTDKGACFTFTLPAASAEAAPRVAAQRSAGQTEAKTPILIVDDDPQALYMVRNALSTAGYAPLTSGDPGKLAELIRTERPSLVLLDLMLPRTDGIELMNSTPELAELPIIFISGYGRDETIARALENGAADYIVKPFSAIELVARVQAVLRNRAGPQTYARGDLRVDFTRRQVSLAGCAVALTATEFDLLRLLAANAGGVVTTDMLLRQVWGHSDSNHTDRVRAAVRKLRAKLGDDAAAPVYIFTEHGVGYRLAASTEG